VIPAEQSEAAAEGSHCSLELRSLRGQSSQWQASFDQQQALAVKVGRSREESKALLCHKEITPFESQLFTSTYVQ
jgi:hypothetical protein